MADDTQAKSDSVEGAPTSETLDGIAEPATTEYGAQERRTQEYERAFVNFAATTDYAHQLSEALALYSDVETFAPGDLVQWKSRLRSMLFPPYGYPAIVVRLLDAPSASGNDDGGWSEPNNMVIGVLDPSGDLIVFPVNSARLTRY